MHYRAEGHLIRSENGAKPGTQASQYVTCLLGRLAPFDHALDYGCGKLRYSQYLRKLCKRLTLVDSQEQVSRQQILLGCASTVHEYVKTKWRTVRVLAVPEFYCDSERYDFILCANVLSAIPDTRKRMRALRLLSERLCEGGQCLLVCQYTNSYFWARMRDPLTIKYNDGFITGSKGNASYYGMINLEKLLGYVRKSGMIAEQAWRHDQSAYVIAGRRSQEACLFG